MSTYHYAVTSVEGALGEAVGADGTIAYDNHCYTARKGPPALSVLVGEYTPAQLSSSWITSRSL